MGNCININHSEFKSLVERSGLNSIVLASKMGVWMDKNKTDEWPTLEQIGVEENTSFKKIKDDVKSIFSSYPELSKIGTMEEYSQYLDELIDDSVLKDVLIHFSKNKFDKFDKKYIGS